MTAKNEIKKTSEIQFWNSLIKGFFKTKISPAFLIIKSIHYLWCKLVPEAMKNNRKQKTTCPTNAFHDPKGTFSISESEERLRPSSISGGVKARRSFCVTFSSVKEMFPEGMSSSDHGEMIKPNADGSVEPEVKKKKHALLPQTAILRTWPES